jgi:Flp pilus assembly protein CpaB
VLAGLALLSASILIGAYILRAGAMEVRPDPVKPTIVAEFDTVSVPVPAVQVAPGTRVKDIRFKMVSFPRHQIPEGAIRNIDALQNGVAIAALPANLPLFVQNFRLNARGSNPVIERIPSGMRAITIRVDATSAVEGWAGSGSLVDVMLIEKDSTTVVAERVKILSTERKVAAVEGEAAPSVPSTVTLLVTQEQALAINTAIPRGRIAFALRSFDDEERWRDRSYNSSRLKGGGSDKDGKGAISGYAAVKGGSGQEGFALSDGHWVRTEVVPEGFLAAGRKNDAKN